MNDFEPPNLQNLKKIPGTIIQLNKLHNEITILKIHNTTS